MSATTPFPGLAGHTSLGREPKIIPEPKEYNPEPPDMPGPRRPTGDRPDYESSAQYGTRLDRIERALERLVERDERPRENLAGRSVDTLRRDIGIFAILMGMMVQTGAAFYWAGGMSKQMESQKELSVQIQAEQAYQRAQNQLIDGEQRAAKARQEERDKQSKAR